MTIDLQPVMYTDTAAHTQFADGFTSIVTAYILPAAYFAVVPWYIVYAIFMDSFRRSCRSLAFLAIGFDLGVTAYTTTIAINARI